ncbi:hypothetical protein BDR03DRAFT_965524 [Suillus americanus]|nr:hypothetical protein BDR03DRAFT_965524 [Suillus americanus]
MMTFVACIQIRQFRGHYNDAVQVCASTNVSDPVIAAVALAHDRGLYVTCGPAHGF